MKESRNQSFPQGIDGGKGILGLKKGSELLELG